MVQNVLKLQQVLWVSIWTSAKTEAAVSGSLLLSLQRDELSK